jgi:hypothetical protein
MPIASFSEASGGLGRHPQQIDDNRRQGIGRLAIELSRRCTSTNGAQDVHYVPAWSCFFELFPRSHEEEEGKRQSGDAERHALFGEIGAEVGERVRHFVLAPKRSRKLLK